MKKPASVIGEMTFGNLNTDGVCDCLANGLVDLQNMYSRKLKTDQVEDHDFQSHWEKGQRPQLTDCYNICDYKGVSINLVDKRFEEIVLHKYRTTFSINRKRGSYLLKFRLKENAGVVAPYHEGGDPTHYNLFKSDQFALDKLDQVAIVNFAQE